MTIGATSGSKKNPGYYGSDDFAIINLGAKVSRSIEFTDKFSLPVFGQVIVNPNAEQAFLVFGFLSLMKSTTPPNLREGLYHQ